MKVRYKGKGANDGSDLQIGAIYEIIGIEADHYRIINNQNMPYLYSPNQFEIVSYEVPPFWITEFGKDGEQYSYPKEWIRPGFFEDFHDGLKYIVNQFWSQHKILYRS